ncbi:MULTISPECIES: penicillin-binding protein 2 [Donghicola]|jgi:penicillin-binding protein 2|uniref:Putative membrane protein n=1 Tax=Donghicola eburneus TaxID=393278 RepID=A0A1M4N612_9RHOB|nr:MULTISPECIES: penicillin-binding protein 2 [Donghicola]MCI5039113.1 penicillin-binding protein 2 [Donghicola eburneus]MCT4578506.1 penicillin-binding protein 2 [Donghicola sp.]SCM69508.1 putative membrane protein [Donghicola eburneus]SFQ47534.1 peptidoglycan glycosyltransferase [Donghicola eburneus]
MRRSERDTSLSHRRITRRGLIVGGLQVSFIALLAARMRHMQVNQAEEFRLLAEENRIKVRLLPPARGLIMDREGTPIATNEPSYRIVIVPEDAGDVEEVLSRLSQIIELSEDELNRARQEMERTRSAPFLPVTIADRVSWDAISKVAVNAPALPGITPEVGLSRKYPLGGDFAHVVGYVGPVSDYDLSKIEEPDQLLRIPRFQIGKVGVEAKMEDMLRGSAGAKQEEVNAAGRVMRELDRREGIAGANLQLTVDHKLQGYIQARLGSESASAVVMDVETGDILSIASAPSFDPNLFVRGISVADYSILRDNDHRPLASKTVQDAYPPGSTFKMVTALAGLEAGVITSNDTAYCPGHFEVGGRRFHCWKRGGHGSMDLISSLRHSCDVYYYDLALKVGIEKIAETARKLGLGERFDVPMSAVAEGLTPDKQWKLEARGAEWLIGDTVNASIGQGFVLTTPLQLAVMTSRIATGRRIMPRLIKSIDGKPTEPEGGEDLGLNEDYLRQVRRGMFAVVNNRRGTAYRSRIADEANRMAGKTGTAQVSNRVVRNDEVPWEERDHALFVSFAPYERPKIAVAVVVEHGGGGSSVAAPIARDITLEALFRGPPPPEAYPASDREKKMEERQEIEERLNALGSEGSTRA